MTDHWCKYCNGVNTHNCQFNPNLPRTKIYTNTVSVSGDEALLRQALEVLSRTHQTAMEQAMKARVPECGEFAEIFQDLDFVAAAELRRLHAEAESLRTDAERYRWLRDKADSITVCNYTSDGEWIPLHPQNIDSTIDAAMEADLHILPP